MNKKDKVQEINFLEVMPIRYDRIPSAQHIIVIWLFFILVFCGLHFHSYSAYKKLSIESAELRASLDKAISFLGQSNNSLNKNDKKSKVVAVSDEKLNLSTEGFSSNLLSLSENYSDEVWFTQMSFDKEKKSIALEGRTISTSELNKLFSRLKEMPAFIDFQLVLEDISLNFDLDDMRSHKFKITGFKN